MAITRQFSVCSVLILFLGVGMPPACVAGIILFDQPTDTIMVPGNTVLSNASTYEARVLFTEEFNNTSAEFIFNEWKSGKEDKGLLAGTAALTGFNFPNFPPSAPLQVELSPSLSLGVWHHIAFVYDGTEERLYSDGQLVAFRPVSGAVANDNGPASVGAILRGTILNDGFVGFLDTLRISDVARYSGTSFTPPGGDLSSDGNTLLLYNFNDLPGTTTASDESSFGRHGRLGVGFGGATSPTFIPEPSTLVLALLATLGVSFYRRRRRCTA